MLGSPVTLPSVAGLLSFFFLDVLIFLDVHYSIVKVRDAGAMLMRSRDRETEGLEVALATLSLHGLK